MQSWLVQTATWSVPNMRSEQKGIGAVAFRYDDEDRAEKTEVLAIKGGMFSCQGCASLSHLNIDSRL